MNADASFDDALEQYRKSFIARLSQRCTAELARSLVDNQIMPELRSHKDELLDLKVKALVDQFTMAELRQIDAFYTSPVGQRLVSIQSNARAYTDALRRILRNASDRVNAMELASAFVPMNNQAARK